jgi:hypothetical protein
MLGDFVVTINCFSGIRFPGVTSKIFFSIAKEIHCNRSLEVLLMKDELECLDEPLARRLVVLCV